MSECIVWWSPTIHTVAYIQEGQDTCARPILHPEDCGPSLGLQDVGVGGWHLEDQMNHMFL